MTNRMPSHKGDLSQVKTSTATHRGADGTHDKNVGIQKTSTAADGTDKGTHATDTGILVADDSQVNAHLPVSIDSMDSSLNQSKYKCQADFDIPSISSVNYIVYHCDECQHEMYYNGKAKNDTLSTPDTNRMSISTVVSSDVKKEYLNQNVTVKNKKSPMDDRSKHLGALRASVKASNNSTTSSNSSYSITDFLKKL